MTVLRLVAQGPFKPIFEAIEDDEHRHIEFAREQPKVPPGFLFPGLRVLEKLLYDFGNAQTWTIPLTYLFGAETLAQIGLQSMERHYDACAHLGLHPSPDIERMIYDAKVLKRLSWQYEQAKIEVVNLNGWERGAHRLFPHAGAAGTPFHVTVPFRRSNPALAEAAVAKALSQVLADNDNLRRTSRRGQLLGWKEPYVGVRKLYKDGAIQTVYAAGLHKKGLVEAARFIKDKHERLLERDYLEIPEIGDLVDLLPHSRCQAVVSMCGHFGVQIGYPALVEYEGVPISVVIGQKDPGKLELGFVTDHRVIAGEQCGLISRGVLAEMGKAGS